MEHLDNDDIWKVFDIITEKKDIDKTICINCSSKNLVNNSGIIICSECGVINKELLDRSIEFQNNNNSRVGCATNYFLPLSSLGTKMGGRSYSRISMIQNKWGRMVYKERSLLNVLNNIEAQCKKYDINKPIIDNAKILFKKINDSKHKYGVNKGKQIIIRGLNRTSLIAACIYHGAEMQGVPRSQKEIAEICSLNVTNVTKGCRKFREILTNNDILLTMESSNAIDFIGRYGSRINLEEKYIEKCKELSENIKKLDIASDHQPPSVAAGCLMLISDIYNLNINSKEISQKFYISDVTIKKTYKKICPYKDILINPELFKKALYMIENS